MNPLALDEGIRLGKVRGVISLVRFDFFVLAIAVSDKNIAALPFLTSHNLIELRRAAALGRGSDAGACRNPAKRAPKKHVRSEEHTSELQSLMRISYAVFCLKKKK